MLLGLGGSYVFLTRNYGLLQVKKNFQGLGLGCLDYEGWGSRVVQVWGFYESLG